MNLDALRAVAQKAKDADDWLGAYRYDEAFTPSTVLALIEERAAASNLSISSTFKGEADDADSLRWQRARVATDAALAALTGEANDADR